jgi:hypothetical protein
MGLAGLPLHKGDSILLCSDGLIKEDLNRVGKQYVVDEEIVESLNSEYKPDWAAIKLVSLAEGRSPDDNISAVTIQYLTPDIIAGMEENKRRVHRKMLLRQILLGAVIGVLVVLVVVLIFLLIRATNKP